MKEKRVAVISGGAKNIGKGIALNFLNNGWMVGIIDVDEQALNDFPAKNGVFLYPGDVSDECVVKEFYSQLKVKFGRLDVIVNNAAIGGFKNFLQLTAAEWRRVIDINLTGYFLMARFGTPLILENPGRGAIINISSTRALMSEPGNEAYSASKAGTIGLTHALANSLGPNLRVNAICPGWILHENENISQQEHQQHLTGRAGTIEDIANLVLFLADEDRSGFITGQYFVVDGGMTRKMIYI
ncbi:SDR family oxidoreductase [Pseudothermotoga lettingae]|uniref:Short-chain dehydrogenase/reductase SDR n=1 Tax=Pseudothermotoga lettingae (strain ATCC BAA-301 / DSM 14385 / NBRC 107922 / TMO) TaxID=416591 RepID=A8F6M0_PSELT|nr:SDR family oxidoreductase [Pseudothermotoga lettingae]ABV33804.1 short-chain dehydrogenase/reductase SDR [Pseudothermotoga lettingae TMO]KUK21370.1 MAG: Short-chain dehydrogenase/reductase SDR [Pseudothermotoga lettingae]GLI49262.1 oxidoreductase [Pseudothermotoga lettingae TMO]HBT26158.1 KR domain-containing protein [Pseudothermotoga sp.]